MSLAGMSAEVWDKIKDEARVMAGAVLEGWNCRLWDFTKPEQFPGTPLGTGT
jgi:hypothetical protein